MLEITKGLVIGQPDDPTSFMSAVIDQRFLPAPVDVVSALYSLHETGRSIKSAGSFSAPKRTRMSRYSSVATVTTAQDFSFLLPF
jgi:hypothetical protein